MPARIIDFNALWNSSKLAKLPVENRVDYLWLYGVADANGSFELDAHAIATQVSRLRPELTPKRINKAMALFERVGLLFTWKVLGKYYGHWVGSEKTGRLPPKSMRGRYKLSAPFVPRKEFTDYLSRHNLELPQEDIASTSRLGLGVGLDLDSDLDSDSDRGGKKKGLGFGAQIATSVPVQNPTAEIQPRASIPEAKSEIQNLGAPAPLTRPSTVHRTWKCPDCGELFTESAFLSHPCKVRTLTPRERIEQLYAMVRSEKK
jgi:hypothetical protein